MTERERMEVVASEPHPASGARLYSLELDGLSVAIGLSEATARKLADLWNNGTPEYRRGFGDGKAFANAALVEVARAVEKYVNHPGHSGVPGTDLDHECVSLEQRFCTMFEALPAALKLAGIEGDDAIEKGGAE